MAETWSDGFSNFIGALTIAGCFVIPEVRVQLPTRTPGNCGGPMDPSSFTDTFFIYLLRIGYHFLL